MTTLTFFVFHCYRCCGVTLIALRGRGDKIKTLSLIGMGTRLTDRSWIAASVNDFSERSFLELLRSSGEICWVSAERFTYPTLRVASLGVVQDSS